MIKLDNNFSIETDSNNFVLKFEKETGEIHSKTGNPIISKNQWFYGNLKGCLIKYSNESLKDCQDIKEVLSRLDEIEALIKSI